MLKALFITFFAIAFVRVTQLYWVPIDIEAFNIQSPGGEFDAPLLGILAVLIILAAMPIVYFREIIRGVLRTEWSLLALFSLCAISLAWSVSPLATIFQILLVGLCYFYALLVSSKGPELGVTLVFALSSAIVAISLLLAVTGDEHVMMAGYHTGAVRGLFHHKNTFGPFASMLLLIAVFGGKELQIGVRYRAIIGIISAAAVISSLSSTAIIVAVVGVLSGIYANALRASRKKMALNIFAATALVVGLAASPLIFDALTTTLGRDATLSNRTLIWDIALPFTLSSPIGTGFGTSGGLELQKALQWQLRIPQGSSVQSAYIQMALDTGWLSVALFFAWLIPATIESLKHTSLLLPLTVSYVFLGFAEVSAGLWPSAYLMIIFVVAFGTKRSEALRDGVQIKPPIVTHKVSSA